MPIVDNFLFCMKLETGGLVIGWLGIICCFLAAIQIFLGISALMAADAGLIFIIPLILFIGMIPIYNILIYGVDQKNHNYILPAMFADVLGCLMSVGNSLIAGTPKGLLNAFITTIISIYVLIILYSLYVKFRNEKKGFTNDQKVIIQQQQVPQMQPGQVNYIPQQQVMSPQFMPSQNVK